MFGIINNLWKKKFSDNQILRHSNRELTKNKFEDKKATTSIFHFDINPFPTFFPSSFNNEKKIGKRVFLPEAQFI